MVVAVNPKNPEILRVDDIRVYEQSPRQGYGSSLFRLALEQARRDNIPTIELGIINPIALRMVAKIVGYKNVQLYTDEDDPTTLLEGVDLEEACSMIEAMQKQSDAYSAARVKFPDGFDPGLHAIIELDDLES